MIQMQITLSENVMETIRAEAAKVGISPGIFTRMILYEKFGQQDAKSKSYNFTAENWQEIEAYVEERKLGDVANFAVFAMHQYMSRNSLSEAQKRRVEGKYGIRLDG